MNQSYFINTRIASLSLREAGLGGWLSSNNPNLDSELRWEPNIKIALNGSVCSTNIHIWLYL